MSKNKNHPLYKVIIGEVLFWFHTAIVLFMIVAGLFMSFWWVLAILIAHRIHLIIFHGCLITRLEQREGAMGRGTVFYQLLFRRLFGLKLSRPQVRVLSLVIGIIGLAVAGVAQLSHFRIGL